MSDVVDFVIQQSMVQSDVQTQLNVSVSVLKKAMNIQENEAQMLISNISPGVYNAAGVPAAPSAESSVEVSA